MELEQVAEFLEELSKDSSIPQNIRLALCDIKCSLDCTKDRLPVNIDAALQKLEEVSNNPNLSAFNRTEIWSLTSAIESLNR